MTTPEIETDYTSEVVCPYCGHEECDSWELSDDDGETECNACEKSFIYTRHVFVEYCTKKKEG